MEHTVYLDNAATTPLDQRVLDAMLPYLRGGRGNPSSLHAAGAAAREAVEAAREAVAAMLGAHPEEILFTAGGTEADNLAVLGLARAAPPEKRHVVVSRVEHSAVREAPVATLAISAHKLYGPQGAGALYVREGVSLESLVFGGGQERGLRSGTENVAGLVGLGEAARLANRELEERAWHERRLRDRILAGATAIPGGRMNGHPEKRLSNNVHLTVEGVEAEGLVLFLDSLGYAVGSGSACASGSAGHKATPGLLAMGRGEREAFSSVRVTVGKDNTDEEVEGFLEAFTAAVARLRELSPLYTRKS